MRCTSVEKDECWKGIDLELTEYSIRLLLDLFHIDVVHMSLLKWVWLVCIISFLLRALIGIMTHLLTLEAFHLTDILPGGVIMVTLSIVITISIPMSILVVPFVTSIVVLIASITVITMVVVAIVVAVLVPILVESRSSTSFTVRACLMGRSRTVLVEAMLPLPVLGLLQLAL